MSRAHAIEFFNRGVSMAETDKQMAYRSFVSAVDIDPTFAQGWYHLGIANAEMKLIPAAIGCLRRATALPDSDQPGEMNPELRGRALTNLCHQLYHMGYVEEARATVEEALALDPALALAWLNLSLIASVQGNDAESIETARKAFAMEPSPTVEIGLAFALMFGGHYAEGFKHFEARFPYKIPKFDLFPFPKWQGEPTAHLYIAAEQGLGDSLCFTRFIPEAARRAEKITLAVQAELVRLLSAMFQETKHIVVVPMHEPFPDADAWVSIGSLPVALGLTDEQIAGSANVPVPAFTRPTTWKAPNRKLHIGIAWAGSAMNEIERWRRMPMEIFLELYRVQGIQLYSLQIGDNAMDVHRAGCAGLIKDLAPYVRDVADTVAIVNELDLIICVETSLGHIAGAVGKECWVLLARNGGDYRCGRHGDTPLWYPNTRLFRQDEDARWEPVIERIAEALRERVAQ